MQDELDRNLLALFMIREQTLHDGAFGSQDVRTCPETTIKASRRKGADACPKPAGHPPGVAGTDQGFRMGFFGA
jgi:hypothetical protein